MTTGPLVDRPLVLLAGVLLAPPLVAALTAWTVRRRAGRRGVTFRHGWRRATAAALAAHLGTAFAGLGVLALVRGIPPGLDAVGTLGFLLAVFGLPAAAAAALFGGYLDRTARPGDLSGRTPVPLRESATAFAGAHLGLWVSLWVALLAAS